MYRLSAVIRALGVCLPLLALGAPALAQSDVGRAASQAHMTRQELQDVLARYEQFAHSPEQDGERRVRARYEASLIRNRLEEGDFQVGDRIALRVAGEPALTDTFVVKRDRAIELPNIGDISLRGVLRSELQDHLTEQLGQHIRNPVVRSESFIRVSILGAIGRPGFYVLPSDQVLTDALMVAGGPGQGATLTRIRVERGNQRIWEGQALQQAIVEGRTLDQLNLRAGDRIVVPQRTPILRSEFIYGLSALLSLGFAISQIFF